MASSTNRAGGWQDGYLPQLDGLRGIAVLLVMGFHANWVLWAGEEPRRFMDAFLQKTPRDAIEMGWIGVDLFFCLSGYLISSILLASAPGTGLSRFYQRRILRILPLYYFVLFIAFILGPMLPGALEHRTTDLDAWRFIFFTHNFSVQPFYSWILTPSWSLGVEIHFYLLWPILFRGVPRKHLGKVLVGLVLGLPVLKWIIITAMPIQGMIYHVSPFRLDTFAAGAFIAWARANPQHISSAQLKRLSSCLACLLLVGIGLLLSTDPTTPLDGVKSPLLAIIEFSLLAIGFSGVIGLVVNMPPHFLKRCLSHPALVYVGKISYGLYLLHLLGFVIAKVGLNTLGITSTAIHLVAMFTLSGILATITWFGLERPCLKLKK